MFDAHIHIGYYARKGFRVPHYYSPRLVCGVLRRCGVQEFIVSSTCAQVAGIRCLDLNREAIEIRRVAGRLAHIFLWVSTSVIKNDRNLTMLDTGLYDGLKLHEEEAHWVRDRQSELLRVLSVANERQLPVQFHSGCMGGCRPVVLARYARKFPSIRFDFAHCPDMGELEKIMDDCPNVWTDTAYWPMENFEGALGRDWHSRLMFGTDLPVWQAHEDVGLTARYRAYVCALRRAGMEQMTNAAFRSYIGRFNFEGRFDEERIHSSR